MPPKQKEPSRWRIEVTPGTQYEECLSLSWQVLAESGYDATIKPPAVRESTVEMVIDRSTKRQGSKEGAKNLEPPKDAMVKSLTYTEGTLQTSIMNMPVGRRFLISLSCKLAGPGTEVVRSPWVRVKTLHPSTRDPVLGNLDPWGVPRLNCKKCPCQGFVPFPKWNWNDNHKACCRCCSCACGDHIAKDGTEILRVRTDTLCKRLGIENATELPTDAVDWDEREALLWILTAGAFHPRRTVGEEQLPPSKDAAEAAGGPEGVNGKVGRVSVLTPTTESRQKFHKQLWKCFEAQHWADKELVVVETYTDSQSSFFTQLAKKEPRLTYVKFKVDAKYDWSIGLKRNMGIHLATGEFIAHFDDDDLYAPKYLDTMVAEIRKQRAQAITLSSWYIYDELQEAWSYCDATAWGWSQNKAASHADVRSWIYGYGFSYMYRRRAALEFPYSNINMGEDFDFLKQLQKNNGDQTVALFHDDFGICLHIQHGQNTSNSLPIRRVSKSEARTLDVASLSMVAGRYLKRGDDSDTRVVRVHAPDGEFSVSCAAGSTVKGFLNTLAASDRCPQCVLRHSDRLLVFCVPPKGSQAMCHEIAAAVRGIPLLNAETARENILQEQQLLFKQMQDPMKRNQRISSRMLDLWLQVRDEEDSDTDSDNEENDAELQEELTTSCKTIALTCQNSKVKKFLAVPDAITVSVPAGGQVYLLRWAMGRDIPADAKFSTLTSRRGLVGLQDTDIVPDKVLVSEFLGRRTFYAYFSVNQCRVSLSVMKKYFGKKENQWILDDLENKASGDIQKYSMELSSILISNVYPAILRRLSIPGDVTGGARVIMSGLDMGLTRVANKTPMDEDWWLEFDTAKLWQEVERLMRNRWQLPNANHTVTVMQAAADHFQASANNSDINAADLLQAASTDWQVTEETVTKKQSVVDHLPSEIKAAYMAAPHAMGSESTTPAKSTPAQSMPAQSKPAPFSVLIKHACRDDGVYLKLLPTSTIKDVKEMLLQGAAHVDPSKVRLARRLKNNFTFLDDSSQLGETRYLVVLGMSFKGYAYDENKEQIALSRVSPLPTIDLPPVKDSPWHITVRQITGECKIVAVDPDDSIRIVKARLRQQEAGSLKRKIFKLVLQDRSLRPADLVHAHLKRGSVVDAVMLQEEEPDDWWEPEDLGKHEVQPVSLEELRSEPEDLCKHEVHPVSLEELRSYRQVAMWSGQRRTWKALAVHEDVVFGSTCAQNTVVAMTLTGETIREFRGMNKAEGVAVDKKHVYVSDQGGNRVMIFEKDTAQLMRCSAQGQVKSPHGLAVDGSILYVACVGDGTLYAFNLENRGFAVKWATDRLRIPIGICYDSSHVYVAEWSAGCITVMDKQTGTKIWSMESGLLNPHGLELVGNSHLIVAESGSSTVRILDKQSGADVTQWSVNSVCAVAVSAKNVVYAAGHWGSANAIHVFSINGD